MTELLLIAKATVALGLAFAATRATRHARASVRSMILAATFASLLLLPLVAALASPRQLQVPDALAPVFFVEESTVSPRVVGAAAAPASPAKPASQWPVPSRASLLRAAWALGVMITAAPLLLGLWRTRAIRHHGRGWTDGHRFAVALATPIGVRRPLSVVCHDGLIAPMTCGWLRPTLAMPADAPNWPAADVRRALLHELEHVRRHDWPIHILARLVCALYWFHPAVWIAWRQLSLESERACDDAVVLRADDAAYAQQLVSLARRFTGGTAAPLLSMADHRTLATRVAAILNRNVPRGRVGTAHAAAIVFGATALCVTVSPLQAVPRVAAPSALAQQTAATTRFEVASIRRNTSSRPGQTITQRGNTFVAENVTLHELVLTAFNVNANQVSGLPGWAQSERYDVLGQPAREATWPQQLQMLQQLLADRFNLSVRRETRPAPAYALVVSKNGSRLRAATDCTPSATGVRCGGFSTRPGHFTGRHVTLAQVASLLSGRSGRPVENNTGIDGVFDVELTWTPDPGQLPPGPGPDNAPAFDPSGPSLFTALEEQLGLKLEATTRPLEHLVIERVARPTPNDAVNEKPAAQERSASVLTLRFPVASIRPNDGSDPGRGFGFTPEAGRLRLRNQTLRSIISIAYSEPFGLFFPDERISGGPPWMDRDRFTIEARAERAVSANELGAMLRTLLADRFNLQVRLETRQAPIYALVLSKPGGRLGPELRRSDVECGKGGGRCGIGGGGGRYQLAAATMPLLAASLSELVGRPVVDRTGLTGSFDGTLTWAATREELGALGERAPASPEFGASLFTALDDQFGLKLQSERGGVNYLVVTHADQPTPNDAETSRLPN